MSSLNNLFNRVQMLEEAKVSPVGKQAPVFKNVPKQMKAAGLAASSRDAMIFITQVLSRLDIISPEVYEMTIKGQHKERMEKLMTILRSKEDEINDKSDEIVEYINQNLDNYTAGAGSDRARTDKYKETAKEISQEVQNIKAGKEADDALRDIVKTADSDLIDSLEFGAEDTTTIVEINAGNAANVEKIRAAVEEFANEMGVEVTGNTVEFSVDEGSAIDQMVKKYGVTGTEAFLVKHFEGEYPVTASIIPPAGAEEKSKVAATVDALSTKPEGTIGREHVASVNAAADKFLKSRNLDDAETEDAEGKHDDNDGKEERCDYVPCEDGEYELDDEAREMLSRAEDILGNLEDQGFDDLAANGIDGAEEEHADAEGDLYNLQDQGWTQGSAAWHLSRDIVRHGRKAIPATEDAEGAAKFELVGSGGRGSQVTGAGQSFNSLEEVCAAAGVDPSDCANEELWDDMGDGTREFQVDEDNVIIMRASTEDAEGETVSIKGLGLNPALVRSLSEDGDGSYDGTVGSLKQHINNKLALRPDIGVRGRLQQMLKQLEGQDDAVVLSENVITESKNSTSDSLLDIYASVKPIVETIVESTTINENGQTTPTQQYLVEKAEIAIENAYTNQYLTEQKASDSLLVTKEEKSESFKERYQPKTSYQLEELRRYGL